MKGDGTQKTMQRIAFATVVLISSVVLLAQAKPSIVDPATAKPEVRIVTKPPAEVVELWPAGTLPPATQPESIELRYTRYGQFDRTVRNVSTPRLTVFLPKNPLDSHPSIVICPGGGYSYEAIDREGFDVAQDLNGKGIAAFVLTYRLPNGEPPKDDELAAPAADSLRAIRVVREGASKWGVDAHHIGVIGFSAGGHVAGCAVTMFDDGDSKSSDPMARVSSRPDFGVLMYPVMSMSTELAHGGSRKKLLGDSPSPELVERYSIDKRVTEKTPPLFLVHAKDDKAVNPENTDVLAAAAKAKGVPVEVTLYESGGHGFGVGADVGEAAHWVDKFADWLGKTLK